MCESNVFYRSGDGEEEVMADVSRIVPKEGKVHLTNLLGEELTVLAEIEEMDLMAHKIYLKKLA